MTRRHKILALCPERPKRDQNPKFTPLSETMSIPICFICESPPPPPPDILIQWISCVKVASNFLFRLSIWHVGRMNTQVWLLNSLVRLTGWVTSEFVGSMRNMKRMMFNSVHNVGTPSEMSYLLFIYFPCQHRRMAEGSLPESQESCLEIAVLLRQNRAENLPWTVTRHPTELQLIITITIKY